MGVPKHIVIRESIEADIHRGVYKVGDRLPTEQELMDRFGVSRNPIQKAMSALVESGMVSRKRGSGTIVASTGLRSNLLRLMDPRLTDPEVAGEHRVLDVNVASSENLDLGRADFEAGQPTALLTRLKCGSEDQPLALERCAINLLKAPNVLSQDLAALTTIAYYNSIGLAIRRVSTVLSAVHLSSRDVDAMGLQSTEPVIRQLRTVHATDGTVLEVAEFFIHPRNMTLEVSQIDNQ